MRPILAACILIGCSSSGGSDDPSIKAELEPLAGFSYDSGQIPSGSPVTLDLKASAGGKLTLESGSEPNSGRMAIDAGISLGATIKSTLPGASYDGPLQGAPALDIKIAGETPFDLLTVGAKAQLDAPISPTDLATIPLATALGIPAVTGDLTIKLAGGTVTSTFTTTCASDGHFAGDIDIGGTVTLGGSLKVVVPLLGEKTFDLGVLSMQVPTLHKNIVFATPADPMATGCTAAGGAGGGGGDGSGGGGGSGDGATCTAPASVSITPSLHSWIAHANQCSATQITNFVTACDADSSTDDTCRTFLTAAANANCSSCLVTDSTDTVWGAFVDGIPNYAGCIAQKDSAQTALATSIAAYGECMDAACGERCSGAPSAQRNACLTAADGGACASYADASAGVPTGNAAACMDDQISNEQFTHYYANLFCGTGI